MSLTTIDEKEIQNMTMRIVETPIGNNRHRCIYASFLYAIDRRNYHLSAWMNKIIRDAKLIQDVDYIEYLDKAGQVGRPQKDILITIDAALSLDGIVKCIPTTWNKIEEILVANSQIETTDRAYKSKTLTSDLRLSKTELNKSITTYKSDPTISNGKKLISSVKSYVTMIEKDRDAIIKKLTEMNKKYSVLSDTFDI